jgi:hypothetical protein
VNYLVLLYQNPANFSTGAARDAEFQAYDTFTQAIRSSGHFVSGTPLIPVPDQLRTVRSTGATKGPAHPNAEALVGMYVLDCKDIDEAAMIAGKIPAAKTGSVEVVPFMAM